jgi:predicted  nucleic acid-binding Zn-ribbon protein
MRKMLQNLETVVNEDLFRMLDNMSLCVTQKDTEVQGLHERVEKLEDSTESLQKKLKTQTKDYEGMLAILDLKLEEKIREIKKNQEAEIGNIKRMMINQIDSDLPLSNLPLQMAGSARHA